MVNGADDFKVRIPDAVEPLPSWRASGAPRQEIFDGLSFSQALIVKKCEEVKELLIEKNRKYGDSALNPQRIFSNADPMAQIDVRLDDKLSRIASGQADEDEDVYLDLTGYLILRMVASEMQKGDA